MYKKDFPIFQKEPLVYLDSAASAQKPDCVLKALYDFYTTDYANVHRGVCDLAIRATDDFEKARQKVAGFFNTSEKNIVWTKGATEAINLVANGFSLLLNKNDEILISIAEHHANFVPWQLCAKHSGATLKFFNVLPDGTLDFDDFQKKLSAHTKVVALTHMSNVLGVLNPAEKFIKAAHQQGAMVLLDVAQSSAHTPIDVQKLGCDFMALSGHKLYGPTGIGVLYGTTEALEKLPVYQGGGDMIKTVSTEETTFAEAPAKFEAGTPPFAQTVGFAAAISYVQKIGWKKIQQHESELTKILIEELKKIPRIRFLGNPDLKEGLVCFNIDGIHPADLAFGLSKQNVCVRIGHHCAMPIHNFFKTTASLRVSLGLYNDSSDIEAFIKALHKTLDLLA